MTTLRLISRIWRSDDVERHLSIALSTIKYMPTPDHRRLNHLRSAWPAAGPDEECKRMAYGYQAASSPRPTPTGYQQDHCDHIVHAVTSVAPDVKGKPDMTPDAIQVVMARAGGVPWRLISQQRKRFYRCEQTKGGGRSRIPGGNSEPRLRRLYLRALFEIADALNARRIQMPVIEAFEAA